MAGISSGAMPFAVDPPGDDVVARMGRAWRELRRGASTWVVRDRMFGVGADAVEPGHMDVLDLLVQRPEWRMSELATALRVDPSTVTRTLQRMEAAGLAERHSPASGDRRAVIVKPTDFGRRRHASIAARRVTILTEIMAPLSESQRKQLVELLERFIESADKFVAEGAPLELPAEDGS
jgi:DNA-binding MarR family transcriptional regulator